MIGRPPVPKTLQHLWSAADVQVGLLVSRRIWIQWATAGPEDWSDQGIGVKTRPLAKMIWCWAILFCGPLLGASSQNGTSRAFGGAKEISQQETGAISAAVKSPVGASCFHAATSTWITGKKPTCGK